MKNDRDSKDHPTDPTDPCMKDIAKEESDRYRRACNDKARTLKKTSSSLPEGPDQFWQCC